MELHQLHMLRELGELGSVKAVADTLSVTPSAVSQQIALLQRHIDTPLTRRDGRNLVLTEAGKVLATAGAQVMDAMAAAQAAIGAYQDDTSGTVTISGFHSAGQALFAPLVRKLAARRMAGGDGGSGASASASSASASSTSASVPQLRFSDEDVAQQDFAALTARYDLVLAHRMDHSPPWPQPGLHVIPLAREPLDVAVAIDHPLAAKAAVSAADVVRYPWVSSRSGYSPADVLVAVGAMASHPVEVLHRINDYSAAAALVSTGEVIGLLPRYTSGPVLNPGGADNPAVALRPLTGINTRRRIDLLARPENLRRASVQLVAQAMQEVMAELVASGS